jgi:large subunit ribosomal protein L21
MYAIVEIAGQQFKVEKDQQIYVHRLEEKEGAQVAFDNVLLIDNDGKINVGAPAIEGAQITAKVLQHVKGDKVIVFKKKRRKGYKVRNGHRQFFTHIEIEKIVEKGAKKVTAKKADPAPKEVEAAAKPEVKAETPKAPTKAKAEAAEKKATGPKAEKPAAKKPAAKKTASAKTDKGSEVKAEKKPAKKDESKKDDNE